MGSFVGLMLALVFTQVGPAPQGPPPIGWAELEQVKVLLAEAQRELQPQQFELLERELVEAESAFQRYSSLVRASGEAAEIARGAEALASGQRVSRIASELGKVSRVGPLLIALAMMWPSGSIASQDQEFPPRNVARRELEVKLAKIAEHSQKIAEEMEAAAQKKPKVAPVPVVEPAKEAASGKAKCGTCVCYYRGFGPDAAGPRATRAQCKEYCRSDELGHRPANGMLCTGDKAVEWWN